MRFSLSKICLFLGEKKGSEFGTVLKGKRENRLKQNDETAFYEYEEHSTF
jgi:hypothetical protein